MVLTNPPSHHLLPQPSLIIFLFITLQYFLSSTNEPIYQTNHEPPGNRALLSAPFVPFIVIFCHVIETSNTVYLSKLASLVDLLKVATPNLPGAYGKQCSIFTLMYEVACKYVEARAAVVAAAAAAGTGSQQMHQTHQQMQHLVSAEEFDDLFGDAGLIGAQLRSPILRFSEAGSRQLQQQQRQGFGLDQGTGGEGDAATSGERTAGIENGINLGNWFDQNHQIFRMMDDADS